MRRSEPGNDISELHYKAGEWTRARVGPRQEGQLEFLVIIILARNEEGLKRNCGSGEEAREKR